MLNRKRSWLLGVSSLAMILTIVASFLVFQAHGTHAAGKGSPGIFGTSRTIDRAGTTSSTSTAALGSDNSVHTGSEYDKALFGQGADSSSSSSSGHATVNRSSATFSGDGVSDQAIANSQITSNPNLVTSFDGLNHRQQRLANGGNQFSLEPPDQGLCAGNGFVMEVINDVRRVFDPSGNPLTGVQDLNTFFGYAPAIIRPAGPFGPFVTDPSCYFDQPTQRWFVDVLTLEVDPNTGAFLGPNHLDLAVSTTANPTGAFVIYRLPVQDDGTQGTPNHHCDSGACLGDYPHIGADANGFYITTNEYGLFAPGLGFHAAQIYAFSKSALAANNAIVTVTQFDTIGTVRGNPGFTVWPAETPGSGYATVAGGTEYFLSSDAAPEANGNGTSRHLILWALTNTQALNFGGTLTLRNYVQTVLPYTIPAPSQQKAGDFPLGQCLNDTACSTFLNGTTDPFAPEVESSPDSNDTRMQQVTFEHGLLWGALDTALNFGRTTTNAGIEWFQVFPLVSPTVIAALPVGNGYLGLPGVNMTYPAIGVTDGGKGVMAFTLLGPNNFPSAAYADIYAGEPGEGGGIRGIHIAAAGLGPDDGFTGYAFYNAPFPIRTRWGDYGGAVAVGNSVWIASEYIGQTCTLAQYEAAPFGSCGGTRTALANWDTRISLVTPP